MTGLSATDRQRIAHFSIPDLDRELRKASERQRRHVAAIVERHVAGSCNDPELDGLLTELQRDVAAIERIGSELAWAERDLDGED